MWGGVACFSDDEFEQSRRQNPKLRRSARPSKLPADAQHTIGNVGNATDCVQSHIFEDDFSNRLLLHTKPKQSSKCRMHHKAIPSGSQRLSEPKGAHEQIRLNDHKQLNSELVDSMACCPCTRSETRKARIVVVEPSEYHEKHHATHNSDVIIPDCGALSRSIAEFAERSNHRGCEYRVTVNSYVTSHKWDDADTDLECVAEEPTYLSWRLLSH